ncbi:trace amine-associated receptor 6-like [Salmo salar]|uniref:Trace amine-associated receptor 6-like n=1 Tax=Salmo salar TaxID=8030 RepID=A0ABM3DNF7_SALSA|nr:trace amine-associated receptor 6-like [Salmo salar]
MEKHEDVQYCFQDRNSSCRKALLSTSIYIALYIFFSLISAVTVFLNVLVIISISHFKQLHTTTNLLILSLAVSDLLVGLIVIPATTVAIMESCWGFGEYFCVFQFYIAYLCTSLSLGSLVLISIDRYVAVCDPLLYHSKITTTRMMCCISITWCCCIIYDAAIIKNFVNVQVSSRCFQECFIVKGLNWVNIIGLVITMVVPCSIIITLYMKIFVVARSQARKNRQRRKSLANRLRHGSLMIWWRHDDPAGMMIPLECGRLMSRLRRKTLTIRRRPDVGWAPAEPTWARTPLESARAWKPNELSEAPPVSLVAAPGPDVTTNRKASTPRCFA